MSSSKSRLVSVTYADQKVWGIRLSGPRTPIAQWRHRAPAGIRTPDGLRRWFEPKDRSLTVAARVGVLGCRPSRGRQGAIGHYTLQASLRPGRNRKIARLKSRRICRDPNLAGFPSRLYDSQAQSVQGLPASGLVVFVALRVSVVQTDELAFAFHHESDLMVGSRRHAALAVQDFHRDVGPVAAIRGDLRAIHCQADGRRLSRGGDFDGAHDLAILGSHRFQRTRFIWDVPLQMQIVGGAGDAGARPSVSVAVFHAVAREGVALRADGFAVEEKLHRIAVGVAGHGDELALPAFPVPVRGQVQHASFGPLALVEVEAVLLEAAGVDHAGGRALARLARFTQVIDAGPHEVAGHVVVGADESPQLFDIDVAAAAAAEHHGGGRGSRRGGGRRGGGEQSAIIAARAAHGPALRADHAPLGKGRAIDAVVFLFAGAPAIHVVVANHVELRQELGADPVGQRLGSDLVAAGSHQARRILGVKYLQQLAQGLGALGAGLVADFVAGAPQYDARMIAVAVNEVLDVALVPLVEIVGVAVGADLSLADLPLVERLVHHEEAHAVAEIQEFRCVGIVAGADGVASHLAQDFQAAFPDALRDGGADASGLVVQADPVQLDVFAVEQESLVGVEQGFADAGGRIVFIHDAALVADRGVNFVEVGIGHRPEAGVIDAHPLHELGLP